MEQSTLRMDIDNLILEGEFIVPAGAKALVIFAHGSGSGRHSPRNTFVASVLQQRGLATLLVDLLSEEEDSVYETRFNIDLLTERLNLITEWMIRNNKAKDMSIGYFGASTGAAAALRAAAARHDIKAIVSRGGRVDLASEVAEDLRVPTLFIVGQLDYAVLEANHAYYDKLTHTEKEFAIVPGATHLFEESGALEQVAQLAADWFAKKLK